MQVMKSAISLPDLDFEYKLWKNRLNCHERELQLYRSRLMALELESGLPTSRKVGDLQDVAKDLRRIRKQILVQEEAMGFYSRDYPIKPEHEHYQQFTEMRDHLQFLLKSKQELIASIDREFGIHLFI